MGIEPDCFTQSLTKRSITDVRHLSNGVGKGNSQYVFAPFGAPALPPELLL